MCASLVKNYFFFETLNFGILNHWNIFVESRMKNCTNFSKFLQNFSKCGFEFDKIIWFNFLYPQHQFRVFSIHLLNKNFFLSRKPFILTNLAHFFRILRMTFLKFFFKPVLFEFFHQTFPINDCALFLYYCRSFLFCRWLQSLWLFFKQIFI